MQPWIAVVLLSAVFAYSTAFQFADDVDGPQKRGALDCKELGEECRGAPKCCGNNQCYWENGYSLIEAGVCVTCVRANQKCQRDDQCCSPLVCQKGKALHTDGRCQPKRRRGEPCHEDDQCMSNNCDQKWWQVSEGECQ